MKPKYSWGTGVLECSTRHLGPDGEWREKAISPILLRQQNFCRYRNSLACVTGCHLAGLAAQKGLGVDTRWFICGGQAGSVCQGPRAQPGQELQRGSPPWNWHQQCPGAHPLSVPFQAVLKDNQAANTWTEAETQRDEARSAQAL